MTNPFSANRGSLSEEEAQRIVAINDAYAALYEAISAHAENPSRHLSIAKTLLEMSHAMAIRSVHPDALP